MSRVPAKIVISGRRAIAALGLGLLAGSCGAPALSSGDALTHIQDSMADADIAAKNVRLDSRAPSGTYRAVARVEGSEITVTLDRQSGAFRRIEVADDALTDRQLSALAKQRFDTGAARFRVRQITLAVGALAAAAALGLVLARRARLREERALSTSGRLEAPPL